MLFQMPVLDELIAIAIAYQNGDFIAKNVLKPESVGTQEFKYLKKNKGERFTIPDTKVGRKTVPNMVSFGGTLATDSTDGHALMDFIPADDIVNGKSTGYDPVANSVEALMNLILLDREKRTASLLFDANNYAAANKNTSLATTTLWSAASTSDPMTNILTGINALPMRANGACMSYATYQALATHPKIVSAVYKNSGTSGIVPAQAIAELFGLKEFFVGDAYYQTAVKGQTEAYSQVWGKAMLLYYKDKLASRNTGTTFGFCAEFGKPVVDTWEDKKPGVGGGLAIKVGENVKEILCAPDLAYLISPTVA
jgi:hypothetical protein